MNRTSRMISAALLGLGLFAAPMAFAEGSVDAATQETVTAQLVAEGYDVRKFDFEDGMIEVYAVKDGKTWQIFLDAELKVVKTCEGDTCTETGDEDGDGA